MFKVNFEKAYDSISWEFLLYMLKRLGFRSKWIHWINKCLESSWASVSVNGSPIHEFKCFKGLRQGDLFGEKLEEKIYLEDMWWVTMDARLACYNMSMTLIFDGEVIVKNVFIINYS